MRYGFIPRVGLVNIQRQTSSLKTVQTSHYLWTETAISGPIPSPGMRVTVRGSVLICLDWYTCLAAEVLNSLCMFRTFLHNILNRDCMEPLESLLKNFDLFMLSCFFLLSRHQNGLSQVLSKAEHCSKRPTKNVYTNGECKYNSLPIMFPPFGLLKYTELSKELSSIVSLWT